MNQKVIALALLGLLVGVTFTHLQFFGQEKVWVTEDASRRLVISYSGFSPNSNVQVLFIPPGAAVQGTTDWLGSGSVSLTASSVGPGSAIFQVTDSGNFHASTTFIVT